MSALQLNNAVPLRSPSTIKTILPSFDDLLRSLEDSSTSHDSQIIPHHHHHHYNHIIHPPYSKHHRPSTPPTPKSISSSSESSHHKSHHENGRKRSNSVPSVSRTHLKSPFRELHLLPQSVEHHTNRIKSLKEGDGEWASYSLNAVTPSSLPYSSTLARSTTLSSSKFNWINSNFLNESNTNKREILLTPPPSPPIHSIPLPSSTSSCTCSRSNSNTSQTNDTKSNNQHFPFSIEYKRTYDAIKHFRENQHEYESDEKKRRRITDNSLTLTRSWHFIGEVGCSLQLNSYNDKKRYSNSNVAENILRDMIRNEDQPRWGVL
uniref:Uncharacterized protein n=1 Tax=Kwoniella pini CBS 10737 TaxID=1296096 RepID=A0A1B9IAJ2_9TREE|nr:uncharacterized protein I206_01879 [Kwoniella pini CBS 10737]OCF52586.1 hypothetical protein I206_01879 [Kwoniella pini CBS 10737]